MFDVKQRRDLSFLVLAPRPEPEKKDCEEIRFSDKEEKREKNEIENNEIKHQTQSGFEAKALFAWGVEFTNNFKGKFKFLGLDDIMNLIKKRTGGNFDRSKS